MTLSVERRGPARIDKVFRVLVSSEEAGDQWLVARNISSSGMFIEMADPFPLRTKVIVRFAARESDPDAPPVAVPGQEPCISAMARVQNHYYLQYSDGDGLRSLCGVGLRFLRFLPEEGPTPPRQHFH